jgi:hypothetical protein
MTPLTLALFPMVRELRAGRGACCQLVEVQPPAAKRLYARRALPKVGALLPRLCALGVNSIHTLRGLLSPSLLGCLLPAFPGTASQGVLWWEQKGPGVPSWWEPLRVLSAQPLPQRAQRFGPGSLTDIVSVGIYISLTTLSPNGIKSKAGDK